MQLQIKNQNIKIMTLRDYYNGLSEEQKVDFRDKVVKETGRNTATFYRWVNDQNRPSYSDQKLIARMAGQRAKEMFPKKSLNNML